MSDMAAYKKMKVQVRPDAARLLPRLTLTHRASIPARSFPLPRPDLIPRPRRCQPIPAPRAGPVRLAASLCDSHAETSPSPPNRPPDSPAHFIPSHRRNSATRARRRAWTPRASRLCSSSVSSNLSPAPRRRPPRRRRTTSSRTSRTKPRTTPAISSTPTRRTPPPRRPPRRTRRPPLTDAGGGDPTPRTPRAAKDKRDPRRRRRCAPKKSEEEIAAERDALVAAIEADIEKRKERAERFGMPFQLTDLDKRRLEARQDREAHARVEGGGGGEPKEALEGRARRQGRGADARFRNDGAPKNKAKKEEKNKNNRKQGQQGGGAPPAAAAPRSPKGK